MLDLTLFLCKTFNQPASYHWAHMVQVEKIQALRPLEILMTSQQNCFILHGTQLRTPSRVPLQIACTCITHREHAREIECSCFWSTWKPWPFTCNKGDMVQEIVVDSMVGAKKRHSWSPTRQVLLLHAAHTGLPSSDSSVNLKHVFWSWRSFWPQYMTTVVG